MDAHPIDRQDYPRGRSDALAKHAMKPPPNPGEARINQDAIGVGLRRLFDDVVNEPVPDEFMELLRLADERRAKRDSGPGQDK